MSKTKKPRRNRPDPVPTPAEHLAEATRREAEARDRLINTMDSQLAALAAPFCAAFNEVEAIVGDWMNEQGFDKGGSVEAKMADIALMHSELSEALEAIRKPTQTDHPDHIEDQVAEELADCIIRIMHFASQHDVDVSGAIVAKCQANFRRAFMHGKRA